MIPRWASIQAAMLLVADDEARGEGVPVAELARLLDISERRVPEWVARLAGAGDVTGDPGEMLDVEVEGGRVRVHMGPRLRGPLRFTVPELLAVLVVLAQVAPEDAGDDLAKRAAALRARLLDLAAHEARPVAEDVGQRVAIDGGAGAPPHLAEVRDAVAEHRVLRLEYYSASTDTLREMTTQPCAVVQHTGVWYVITSDGHALRIDRVRSLASTEETFEPPADLDLEVWRRDVMFRGRDLEPVTVETPWGRRDMPTASRTQLRAWVRRAAGDVRIVAPPDLRAEMADEVRSLLDRYR